MERCPHCDGELQERWEYCIYCGEALRLAPAAGSPAHREDIPGAIRPEPAEGRRSRLDVPLLIGVVLGTAGVALIVYMAIWLFGPR